ncbi:MAG: hypothetical protein HQM08_17275 [Candidatus Riflebacteria bacterium]|nr:hypothetical protein [Candidatus Riflebacteria bacterium]
MNKVILVIEGVKIDGERFQEEARKLIETFREAGRKLVVEIENARLLRKTEERKKLEQIARLNDLVSALLTDESVCAAVSNLAREAAENAGILAQLIRNNFPMPVLNEQADRLKHSIHLYTTTAKLLKRRLTNGDPLQNPEKSDTNASMSDSSASLHGPFFPW